MGTSEAMIEAAEKRGYDTGLRVKHPFIADAELPGVDRQFRADGIRHRRDLRLPRPRPARPGVRAQVWAWRHPCGAAAGRRCGHLHDRRHRLCRAGHDDQLGLPGRAGGRGGQTCRDRRAGAARRGQRRGELAAARLGCVAAALLGLPDPGDPLRGVRDCSGAGRAASGVPAGRRDVRRAGQSARPPSHLEACRLPALRRAGAARDRYVRHVCGQ